jgi:SRSO17 transposase
MAFRRYREGLLLPAERTKTLTALANPAPVVGAQHPHAQRLQGCLSEATWDPTAVNDQRRAVLRAASLTAPTAAGVLVIDEHGARTWGTKTAHVGKQSRANLGTIDTGGVSVTSRWADERVDWPVDVEPSPPAPPCAQGKHEPTLRTTLTIARDLVARAAAATIPCRAGVADRFSGEAHDFKRGVPKRTGG